VTARVCDLEPAKGLLGLARRAGKVAMGDRAVQQAIRRGRARLIILAVDAAERTRRRYIRLASLKQLPIAPVASKAALGAVLGSTPKAVCAVCDDNFAQGISMALGLTRVQQEFNSRQTGVNP